LLKKRKGKAKPLTLAPLPDEYQNVETPSDIDTLLRSIIEESRNPNYHRLSPDDRAFVTKMIDAINGGSKGVFIVVNQDNSLDYLIANETRVGAIAILARMIQRTARHLEEESPSA
jgi:hypothetical protein